MNKYKLKVSFWYPFYFNSCNQTYASIRNNKLCDFDESEFLFEYKRLIKSEFKKDIIEEVKLEGNHENVDEEFHELYDEQLEKMLYSKEKIEKYFDNQRINQKVLFDFGLSIVFDNHYQYTCFEELYNSIKMMINV